MRSVVMLAIVAAAASGCLAHERPEPEDAATPTPDAHIGHDAAHLVPFDANLPDANFPDAVVPYCPTLHSFSDPTFIYLTERACGMGARQCVTVDIEALDISRGVAFLRCGPGSTHTVIRVTALETAPTGFVSMTPCASDAGETCSAALTNAGDTVELSAITGTPLREDVVETDTVHCGFGEGARYRVEACAIGPCP